jgi:hypothetical protein
VVLDPRQLLERTPAHAWPVAEALLRCTQQRGAAVVGWRPRNHAPHVRNHAASTWLGGLAQAVVREVAPLAAPRMATAVRKGVTDLFQAYCASLSAAFAKHRAPDDSLPEKLGACGGSAPLAAFHK